MRWTIIFFSLALIACSPVQKTAPPPATQPAPIPAAQPPSPAELLVQAEALEETGDFGGAITLLSDATRQYPDAEKLEQALSRVRDTWEPRRQTLEDRLLIVRADALNKAIPLQKQLLEGDPSDRLIEGRIEHSQRQIERLAGLLTRCGERQLKRNERLAKRCLSLSLEIRENAKARRMLRELDSKQKTQRAQESRQQQLKRSEAQQLLVTSHLQQALELVKNVKNQAAIDEIEAISTTGMTELAAAAESSVERKAIISQITDRLLEVGDDLYRTGEIEPAIACWQAVLALDPTQEQTADRMERAQRVVENLNTLRNQDSGDELEGPPLPAQQ